MDELVRTNPILSLVRHGAYHHRLFGGKVRVLGFGPNFNGETDLNWSFKDGPAVSKYLPHIASLLGTKDIYAPKPTEFNALLCRKDALTELVEIKNGVQSVTLHRGALADGLILEPGDLFGNSLGGCPDLVVWRRDTNLLGVAHAGRRSVINEYKIGNTEAKMRLHESVVSQLINGLGGSPVAVKKELWAAIIFPVKPELFTHPWSDTPEGKLNEARCRRFFEQCGQKSVPGWLTSQRMKGEIDLYSALREQLLQFGVPQRHIRLLPLPNGWWTTRGDPARNSYRNLVLIEHVA